MHPNKKGDSGAKMSPDIVVSFSSVVIMPTEQITYQSKFPQKANAFLPFINPNSKAGGIIKSGG
jgi:hypothetical protein